MKWLFRTGQQNHDGATQNFPIPYETRLFAEDLQQISSKHFLQASCERSLSTHIFVLCFVVPSHLRFSNVFQHPLFT